MGIALIVFFAVILLLGSVALEREGADFAANVRFGKAEVVGYNQAEQSNGYTLLVRIPELNDDKLYNCIAGKGTNPWEYPEGAIVDVLYVPRTIEGINVIEAIYLKENQPVDKARIGKTMEQVAFALLGVDAILFIAGKVFGA